MIDGPGRCKCASHSGEEAWHGTRTGYCHHACRCAGCRESRRVAAEAERARSVRGPEERAAWRKFANDYYHTNPEARERIIARAQEWRSQNRAYVNAYTAQYRAARQETSLETATRRRVAWTQAEDTVALSDLSTLEKARILGRTYRAVESRMRTLRQALRAAA